MFIKSCLKADICGRWRKRWKGMTFQVEGSFKVHCSLFTLHIVYIQKCTMSFSWRGVAIPYHRLPKIASSSEGSCHVMEGSFTLITQSQATTLGLDLMPGSNVEEFRFKKLIYLREVLVLPRVQRSIFSAFCAFYLVSVAKV